MAKKPNDIEAIYNAALQKGSEAQRSAYLDAVCGDDDALRARVEALLKAHEQVGDFLEVPAVDPNATLGESPSIEGPGTRIGRYEVLELIGEGGMGLIYLAEQKEPVKRRVALKIVKLGMDTKQVVARFEAERQALALLDHPNIAHVFDAGTAKPGRPYFVMEYVKGMSITKYSDEHRLNIEQRLRLFEQVCEGVHHAHQKGIIHRDIKPSNILVSIHGDKAVPKIIDFGIAKAITQPLTDKTFFTHQGQLLGTPEYMSPEQVDLATQDIDTRSDIYSLGVVLYELLAGVLPFEKKSFERAGFAEIQQTIRELEPASPSIRLTSLGEKAKTIAASRCTQVIALARRLHRELEWIPLKAMRKDRCRRYRSASEMADDVRNYLNGLPLIAGPETATYRVKKFVRKHAGSVATVALVAVVIVLGFIVSTAMYFRAERSLEQEAAARSEAQAVIDFLTDDLLAAVYPEKAKSPEVTVRYVLQAASENLEAKFAGKPLIEAAIRDTLGVTYQKLGDYKAAEPHLERALMIRREQLGEEDQSTMTSLVRLGELYLRQGRYDDAEPLLVKALETRKRVLGEEHPDTLDSMTKLGGQYLFRGVEGRFDEAEVLFAKVLEIGPRVLGEEHPVMLEAMCGRALRYIMVNLFDKAEPLSMKAFQIGRRVLGEEHEVTLWSMNQLVWMYGKQGRYDEALALAVKALEISQRVLGEEHPTTAESMSNLGWLYTQQGRYDEAVPLLTKSVEISRRVLGKQHLFTLFFTNRLAELYGERDQYDEMDTLVVKALEISRRMLGEEHMQTWILKDKLTQRTSQLGSLGLKQYHAGEYEDALATFTRLEELRQLYSAKSTPLDIALTAMSLRQLDRAREAEIALDRLRRMYEYPGHASEEKYLYEAEQLFASDNSKAYQAWGFIESGELDKAAEILGTLKAPQRQKDLATAGAVQSLMKALARAYCIRGRSAEARREYRQAISDYEAAVQIHPSCALALHELARLFATCQVNEVRDGARAIENATKACELTNWENAPYANTLAAAYAESGDYRSAIKWQKKAIDLLTEDKLAKWQANYESRLKLYQSGKPYHRQKAQPMVAWWKLDQSEGVKVIDSSGNGLDGKLEGGAHIISDPIRGNVLRLDGDGDYVLVPDIAAYLNGLDALTLCLWVKSNVTATDKGFIIFEDPNDHDNRDMRYDAAGAYGGGTNLIKCGITSDADEGPEGWPGRQQLESSSNIQTTDWQHLAMTWSSGNRVALYINGKLDTPTWVEPGLVGALVGYTKLFIGKGGKDVETNESWNGLIDDVRIYSYALSEAEIRALHAGDEPRTTEK